jgi:hypothetical protein
VAGLWTEIVGFERGSDEVEDLFVSPAATPFSLSTSSLARSFSLSPRSWLFWISRRKRLRLF